MKSIAVLLLCKRLSLFIALDLLSNDSEKKVYVIILYILSNYIKRKRERKRANDRNVFGLILILEVFLCSKLFPSKKVK